MSGFYRVVVSGNAEYEEAYCHGTYETKANYVFEKLTFLKSIRTLASVHKRNSHIDYMACSPLEEHETLVRFLYSLFHGLQQQK
ncbi:hypothetical protein BN59_01568 [Legionella massiliensis]|uniref:Uncharacterized protein n=1 Tax=Legionella massiliensis TaxID=1034943 RepID=A0A078KS48_9GAMM|nr:hypothetical protein [Legionella massiliensis]CDZ77285.1 hypothetical protein BN59_01568 [Legionella massiliensis]CEE13023.1 hypothetical protein BN1094_01568 [Legionella massiliensis]